ncbi:MAG: HAMP domain-containing histidine kinase [Candidatus Melainabacteria bacterium]|nr:HAMP domain-containing histidine kinase [Candidatus Melainabacteria bacterium]
MSDTEKNLSMAVENKDTTSTRQLEDIVSALTHDLKTPLLAAETSIQHLLGGYFGNLTKEQKQILSLLNQSNSDALRLVKNLLTVFKYETKAYKLLLEPVEILEIIEKAISTVSPMLKEKEICLKTSDLEFQFVCDPFEVERVLVNLLSNAIKYTPNGGHIEILAIKNENNNVTITVKDTGIGISKEELPNLFERFWLSHKSNSASNSTGLGLYLSRQIIEAHGGKIWANSEVGKGTQISFEIPEIV